MCLKAGEYNGIAEAAGRTGLEGALSLRRDSVKPAIVRLE